MFIKILVSIPSFFNSNIGVVTLLVGLFAIYLYLKQKKDYKRNAAKLILQEVRYAEQKIRKYRDTKKYKLWERLLPTNSWNDNIHLFIKELKEIQNLDLISDFYAKASYIDTLIETISQQKNKDLHITHSSQQLSVPTVSVVQQPGDFQVPAVPVQPTQPLQQLEIVIPPLSQQILNDVSMSVEFIYNTPVLERLREISERRWY